MAPKHANAPTVLTDAQIAPVTAMLKAMANESRLRILRSLLEGEQSVTQINRRLGLSQSALSQHLAVLRHEKLVETRRSAQTIYYSLHRESARRVLATLAELDL
ncbi:ArsR/SmtB family transcription factor [Salinicola halophilus]|uniref:ArsR/SmtB family transcription factor n=1 Tax=Salinicola halophilus TaxID=184065 RepID=UPI000DA14139|nr:metalloregulator ArsR/SmtB family transcription factor [Salinicola halophilus]